MVVRTGEHSFVVMYILCGMQPQPWYQFYRVWKGKGKAPASSHFVETICIYHLLPHFGLHLTRKGKREGGMRRLKWQSVDGWTNGAVATPAKQTGQRLENHSRMSFLVVQKVSVCLSPKGAAKRLFTSPAWELARELVPAHSLPHGCSGSLGQALPHPPGPNWNPFPESSSQAPVPKSSCVLRKYFSPYNKANQRVRQVSYLYSFLSVPSLKLLYFILFLHSSVVCWPP